MAEWRRLGGLEFLIVSDGVWQQDAGAAFGLTPRVAWEPFAGPLDDQYRMTLGLNCLVVRSQGKIVLVETGCGDKPIRLPIVGISGAGKLLDNLGRAGIRPEDVDAVITSHLHFDHVGWNTVMQADKPVPTFPRARYLFQKGEWEAAQRPNERTKAAYPQENLEPLADARQLELVEGEAEVVKGVRMVPAPGHTAHHVVVELESEEELLIYMGDLILHPIMMERIAWISAFDVLPLVSLETKKRIIERALDKRALLVCAHAAYPGLGRLLLEEGKRHWESL